MLVSMTVCRQPQARIAYDDHWAGDACLVTAVRSCAPACCCTHAQLRMQGLFNACVLTDAKVQGHDCHVKSCRWQLHCYQGMAAVLPTVLACWLADGPWQLWQGVMHAPRCCCCRPMTSCYCFWPLHRAALSGTNQHRDGGIVGCVSRPVAPASAGRMLHHRIALQCVLCNVPSRHIPSVWHARCLADWCLEGCVGHLRCILLLVVINLSVRTAACALNPSSTSPVAGHKSP